MEGGFAGLAVNELALERHQVFSIPRPIPGAWPDKTLIDLDKELTFPFESYTFRLIL